MAKNPDSISVNEKDEAISRLYSLRAGLSVVAQERETADKLINDANDAKDEVVATADKHIKHSEKDFEKQTQELQEVVERMDKIHNRTRTAGIVPRMLMYTLYVAVGLVGLFFFLYGVVKEVIYYKREFSEWLMYLTTILPDSGWLTFGGAVVCGAMVTLIVLHVPFGCSLVSRRKARRETAELQSEMIELTKKVERAQIIMEADRDRKKRRVAEADANIKQAKKEATEHAMAGLAMIDALDDAYSDMIDVRDWQNVDIIIYALETRRAENIKEALVVVDGERRTERIESAIFDAGNAICQSINMGLRRLQGEMTRCFGILGQIVAIQGDRIASSMQSLGAGIAANNSYLSSLTTQASMNNALLAKANENSRELADNVTALRTSVEYANARKLYLN